MKLKTLGLLSIAAMLSPLAQSAGDIVFNSAKGKSIVITDSTGQKKVLEVTPKGKIRVNGREADFEPPTVVIDAPTSTVGGEATIRTTFTDNQGLFRYSSGFKNFYSRQGELFAKEKTLTVEYKVVPFFGQNSRVEAFATDLSGNTTTATGVISSETGITAGTYVLSEPLNEQISGSDCDLSYYNSPIPLVANIISVTGEFKGQNSGYDSCAPQFHYGDDPDPPDPNYVACVSVSVGFEGGYFPLGGGVSADLNSVLDTSFSETTIHGSGSGGNENYAKYTYMDVVFSDTTPPTISVDMTLRCETRNYSTGETRTEEFGPYHMEGTLQ